MTCQGTHRPWFNRYDSWPLPADLEVYVADTSKPMTCWTRCHYCKLPIGVPCVDFNGRGPPDAAITPAVAIEIRAAELADLYSSHATTSESGGWNAWPGDHRYPSDAGYEQWHAGWLARAIAMHDEEQR